MYQIFLEQRKQHKNYPIQKDIYSNNTNIYPKSERFASRKGH